jgi:hypothetical protein
MSAKKYKTEAERKAASKAASVKYQKKNAAKIKAEKQTPEYKKRQAANAKRWYENHKNEPAFRERIRKTQKKWEAKNRSKILERQRARRSKMTDADKKKNCEYLRKRYRKNMDELKAYRAGGAVSQAQTPAPTSAPATDVAIELEALRKEVAAMRAENAEIKKDLEMICTDLTKLEKQVKWPKAEGRT